MQDILTRLNHMRRPRLLMRAARIGAEDYRRKLHLPRLMGHRRLPKQGEALMHLIEIEDALNDQRLNEDSSYNLLRYIDVLIAIVAEARVLRAMQGQPA